MSRTGRMLVVWGLIAASSWAVLNALPADGWIGALGDLGFVVVAIGAIPLAGWLTR